MRFYTYKKEYTDDFDKAHYIRTFSKTDWNNAIALCGEKNILWIKGERYAPFIYIYRNTTPERLKGIVCDVCASSHENFKDNP